MDRHHPLAGQPVLRLRDCLMYPLALPTAPSLRQDYHAL